MCGCVWRGGEGKARSRGEIGAVRAVQRRSKGEISHDFEPCNFVSVGTHGDVVLDNWTALFAS